jgi:hypothetical protein
MGAAAFLILFVLGFILATAGGIIGLVEAFRVNTVWGLLYLLVPFAALVFFSKFWSRKWTRNAFLMSLAGLASTLLAFPFLGGFISNRLANLEPEIEDFEIEPIPSEGIPPEEVPAEEAPGAEEFAEPIVPAAPQLSAIASAELIQSTDPNERLQQINSSRSDPFAVVPIPPPPQPAPPPAPGGGAGPTPIPGGTQPGGTPTATAPTPSPPAPGGGQTTAPSPGGGTQPGGGTTATAPGGATPGSPPPIEPLPALPEPTLAQGISVSGVVTIGNENYAIVQSPTDGSSQYVRPGQRLANGQVLVKRIEVQGANPVVVLEQNGIEVSQPVGTPLPEEGESPPAETTARLPNLPPPTL